MCRRVTTIVAALVLALFLCALIYAGYWVPWTGFGRGAGQRGGRIMLCNLAAWQIGLALVAVIASAYVLEKRYPDQRPGPIGADMPTYCAWCIHRSGDLCGHPESPVSGRCCGPVCSGEVAVSGEGNAVI
jgi:hypothetical protein